MSLISTATITSETLEKSMIADSEQQPENISDYFSQSQLALALTLQKSKPEDLTTAEYCKTLLKHVRIDNSVTPNELRYIDTVEFWKDQYTKLHIQKKELEDRLHNLEKLQYLTKREDKEYGSGLTQLENHVQQLASDVITENISSSELPRRPQTRSAEIGLEEYQDDEDLFKNDKFLTLCTYALRIKRQRALLDEIMVETTTIDHVENLAKLTSRALVVIDSVLSNSCQSHWYLKKYNESSRTSKMFQNIMNQIAMTYLTCFNASNELYTTIPGRAHMYEITFRMVTFFSKSLDLLHKSSRIQAKHKIFESQNSCGGRSSVTDQEYIVNRSLARCLTLVLKNIKWDTKNSNHCDLLEGILFSILDHTGRLVSEAVFLEHVAASDSIEDMEESRAPVDKKRITLESRYIVQVLNAALGGKKRMRIVAEVLSVNNRKDDICILSRPSTLSNDLVSRTTLLLQSTLIKSAVGDTDLKSLEIKTPPFEESSDIFDEVEEKYSPQWLLERVWALIGWDLIT